MANTRYQLTIGVGASKNRIADIRQSFVEALMNLQNPVREMGSGLNQALERAELFKVDKSASRRLSALRGQKIEFENSSIPILGHWVKRP